MGCCYRDEQAPQSASEQGIPPSSPARLSRWNCFRAAIVGANC